MTEAYFCEWDGSAQWWRVRKARKEHRCEAGCGVPIVRGERYWSGRYRDDHESWSVMSMHLGCHAEGLRQATEFGEVHYSMIASCAVDDGQQFDPEEHAWGPLPGIDHFAPETYSDAGK